MGDLAVFENLRALEKRLSQALDRISSGLKARDEARSAEAEAEARAAEAAERVTALEARLSETQDALGEAQSDVASARAEAEAARAEADTARAQAAAIPSEAPADLASDLADTTARLATAETQLAEKDKTLADLQTALSAAQATQAASVLPEADAEPEDIEKALAVMGRRVERARTERDQARAACDAATDALDELKEATGGDVDDRILALRRQLRLMRTRAEDLAAQVSLLQSGASVDASLLDQGLLAEVETLRQLRDTDAAELDRIVQDMQAGLDMAAAGMTAPDLTEGGPNA